MIVTQAIGLCHDLHPSWDHVDVVLQGFRWLRASVSPCMPCCLVELSRCPRHSSALEHQASSSSRCSPLSNQLLSVVVVELFTESDDVKCGDEVVLTTLVVDVANTRLLPRLVRLNLFSPMTSGSVAQLSRCCSRSRSCCIRSCCCRSCCIWSFYL